MDSKFSLSTTKARMRASPRSATATARKMALSTEGWCAKGSPAEALAPLPGGGQGAPTVEQAQFVPGRQAAAGIVGIVEVQIVVEQHTEAAAHVATRAKFCNRPNNHAAINIERGKAIAKISMCKVIKHIPACRNLPEGGVNNRFLRCYETDESNATDCA